MKLLDYDRRRSNMIPDCGRWKPLAGSAMLSCPECTTIAFLHGTHIIAEDGVVLPAVDCATKGCKFNGFVRLMGWSTRPDFVETGASLLEAEVSSVYLLK